MATITIINDDSEILDTITLDGYDLSKAIARADVLGRILDAVEFERKEREQFTSVEVKAMLERTWDAIAPYAGEMSSEDIVDFLVSSDGMYTDGRFNREKWDATLRSTISNGRASFALTYGLDR